MDEKQKYLLATAVIRRGKDLVPDRFPQPNPETIKAWAVALGQLMETLPNVELWEEAITVWSMELVGERMATPKEVKQAVYVVRDRWEADPRKSRVLAEARLRRQELHDRQIAEGTRGDAIGYKRPASLLPTPERSERNVPPDVRSRWRDIVGAFRNAPDQPVRDQEASL